MTIQIKRYFTGRAKGNSMVPIINMNDKIYIQNIGLNRLKLGDIIAYYSNYQLISHRIIKFSNQSLITKGDNCFHQDKQISKKNILGKVVKIEGKYGTIDLQSLIYSLFRLYFYYRSLLTLYNPFSIKHLLLRLKIDKEIFIKLIAVVNYIEKN